MWEANIVLLSGSLSIGGLNWAACKCLGSEGFKDQTQPELYINTHSVPRSKLCVSFIKTNQLMLYSEIIAVCSQIHTKRINTLCGQNVELLHVKLAVHILTTVQYIYWPLVGLFNGLISVWFRGTLAFKALYCTVMSVCQVIMAQPAVPTGQAISLLSMQLSTNHTHMCYIYFD
jgi:hypothetical protein